MLESIAGHYNYWFVVVLVMVGLYTVMANQNLVKKVIGLSVFQAGVFILFISLGRVDGGSAPIAAAGVTQYSNPLPHVLILTAIVVGVAMTAVALALAARIHEAYRSLESDEITALDRDAEQ
jgi:multicomponent Na+:H+ antiporter subunit C